MSSPNIFQSLLVFTRLFTALAVVSITGAGHADASWRETLPDFCTGVLSGAKTGSSQEEDPVVWVKKLLSTDRTDFELHFKQWRRRPEAERLIQNNLIPKFFNLSKLKRSEAIFLLDRVDGLNEETQKVFRLLLYDRATWQTYISEIVRYGDHYGIVTGSFHQVIEHFPDHLREEMIAYSSIFYPGSKSKLGVYAPKRALDALITQLINPYRQIEEKVLAGENIMQSYQEYLVTVKKALSSTPYGDYELDLVEDVVKIIQDWLILGKYPDGVRITLFGSLPNGRARIAESDIDIIIADRRLFSQSRELGSYVDERIRKKHPNAKLPVSAHLDGDFSVLEAAETSPLQFEVGSGGINLLVYPRIPYEFGKIRSKIVPKAFPFRIRTVPAM